MKKVTLLFAVIVVAVTFNGCQKFNPFDHGDDNGHLNQPKNYSSEVVLKWMDMQLRLIRTNATPLGGLQPGRFFAYCGIAAYESVLPGMPGYRTLSGQLNDMPQMPSTKHGAGYHWAASANAALAAMNRNFFPATSDVNKASIDSLENALNAVYANQAGDEILQRSVDFGKAVAQSVFDWSKTDGASHASDAYTPPTGPGLWVPTPPANAPATAPYWGKNRLLVAGSLDGSTPLPPPAFSTDHSSDFYKMVKEVYDVSQTLTDEQKAIGLYYRDNPGYGGGHYLSILMQVLIQEKAKLDFAALAYAKAGIACVDAGIGCWQVKYQYNIERPITYITDVNGLNQPAWTPLFATPAFPEYTSGHATVAGSFTTIMTGLFGKNYHFTNHTYDYLGMAPRSFNSFKDLANEIGAARVYAGIHYRISCERGQAEGEKIGWNIQNKLKFKW